MTDPPPTQPNPTGPPPTDPVRFGVLGATSTVARLAVMPALRAEPGCELVATASLSHPGGLDGGGPRHHGRYEDLLDDPEVEAVYIPLPNALHRPWVERAASAGRHVLCEKPLAATVTDARAMIAACERAGVVLVEAYMTPYHPRDVALWRLLDQGAVGEPLHVDATFAFTHPDPSDHRWRADMGGGALRDVGPYTLHPIVRLAARAGRRARVTWAAQRRAGPDGGAARSDVSPVDTHTTAVLQTDVGVTATAHCSFITPEHQRLEVVGTDGRITVPRAFTAGVGDADLDLLTASGHERVATGAGDAYRGMVAAFAASVRSSAPLRSTPGDAVEVLRLMEEIDRVAAEGGTA